GQKQPPTLAASSSARPCQTVARHEGSMVTKLSLSIAALLVMCGSLVSAQDLKGDWQGAISVGPRQLRLILHVDKGADTAWKATLASIDQSPDWGAAMPVDSVTVSGTNFKFAVAAVGRVLHERT